MAKRKLTFGEILKQTARENSERLMSKARVANRMAKKCRGENRRKAYRVKSDALCYLVKKLPNCVRISKDIKLTDFVVVELNREQSGLHLPIRSLTAASS